VGHYVLYRLDRRDGGLETRLANREKHLAWAGAHPGIVSAGPVMSDDDGHMAGSLMIVSCADLSAARAIHEADPYTQADLWEFVDIRPFRWTLGGPAS
jgi:uncharacterized protein YciI